MPDWGQRGDVRGLTSYRIPTSSLVFIPMLHLCRQWFLVPLIPGLVGILQYGWPAHCDFSFCCLRLQLSFPVEYSVTFLSSYHSSSVILLDSSHVLPFSSFFSCVYTVKQPFQMRLQSFAESVFISPCLNGSCSFCAEKVEVPLTSTKPYPYSCHPGLWPLFLPSSNQRLSSV